jgi:hypothetical protein
MWVHANTGHWLSQTMIAKRAFYAQGCLATVTKAGMVARGFGLGIYSLLPLSIGLVGLGRTPVGRLGLGAIALTIVAYYVALPDALTYSYCRYFYPVVAPWCIWGLATLTAGRQVGATAAIAGAFAIVSCALAVSGWVNQEPIAQELIDTAQWVASHADPAATLLVHDAGAISEYGRRQASDIVGLKSPGSISVHQRLTWTSCGRERQEAVAEIARASDASYLVVARSWDTAFDLTDALREAGFSLALVRQPAAPGEGYLVYRIQPPPILSRVDSIP